MDAARRHPRARIALCLAVAMAAGTANAARVAGKPALAAKAVSLEVLRDAGAALPEPTVLRPLAAEAKALPDPVPAEKALRVGIARDVGSERVSRTPRVAWQPTADGSGWTARVSLAAPGAAALRLGVRMRQWPEGAELRVRPVGDPQAITRMDAKLVGRELREQGVAWTPITEGEAQVVEVYVPGKEAPSSVRPEIVSASHLLVGPSQLKASGVGASGACQQDVACTASQDPAIARAARSVAKLLYTRNGASYVCSGTLVNDGAPGQVPYLYTAAHCIDSPAVAATLNTFWFFDAAACGSTSPGAYRQLSGGATLLYSDPVTDAALLQLADAAPEGAWFSGWDDEPLLPGASVFGLHHPRGDLKKLARGQVPSVDDDTYTTAAWTTGTTEPGSSGSGVFTWDGGEYLLRGGLRGGSASCASTGSVANPDNRDYYSRLDLAAPRLAAWIKAGASASANATPSDYSGMWYDPDEPGWGITVVQKGARAMITWYTYDADGIPEWFIVPEVTWRDSTSLTGSMVRAAGSAPLADYVASRFTLTPVGSMSISFSGDTGIVAFVLDGRAFNKPVRRLDP